MSSFKLQAGILCAAIALIQASSWAQDSSANIDSAAAIQPPPAAADTAKPQPPRAEVAYSLDFARVGKKDIRGFLTSNGYDFQKAANNPSQLNIFTSDDNLILKAKEPILGLIINKDLNIPKFSKIKIEWGVNLFPEGASYEDKVNNEAIMVYVFFGTERFSSGSLFIPSSPYFIGFFLSKSDERGHVYLGRHYKEGGRFMCLDNPPLDQAVSSEIDLNAAFKKCFGKDAPPITGLSIEVDTSSTSTGKSKAFIRKIEIFK